VILEEKNDVVIINETSCDACGLCHEFAIHKSAIQVPIIKKDENEYEKKEQAKRITRNIRLSTGINLPCFLPLLSRLWPKQIMKITTAMSQ
jgi:hypothetical protein